VTGKIRLGDVDIFRIEELRHDTGHPRHILAGFGQAEWDRHTRLIPAWDWNERHSSTCMSHQTWVLRSAGKTILIDTSVGNSKPRPAVPPIDNLESSYLDQLGAVGVGPSDVDLVISTHIHVDHVGWNTRLVDGTWVPTFPNARYVLPRPDVVFWDPANDDRFARRGNASMENVFADSVAPVIEAGQAVVWDDEYEIDENITLVARPGHTPGNSIVKLTSAGEQAAFIGDMLHFPVQIAVPSWNTCWCEDPKSASASRVKTLTWAADEGVLLFLAHFGGDHAAEVSRSGSTFDIAAWRPLADSEDVRTAHP
jgi:glyoxylase-like metal-dependent hydrolase (beta-lactamase superfamily II)